MDKQFPDYTVMQLSDAWAIEIVKEKLNSNQAPSQIETNKINRSCLNTILAAIEAGELKAETNPNDPHPSCKIIKTSNYIQWAKKNNAGPHQLINNDISTKKEDSAGESRNFKVNSELHERFIEVLIEFEDEIKRIKENNPNRNVGLDNHIRPWLEKKGFNARQVAVFGRIIAEHYNIQTK